MRRARKILRKRRETATAARRQRLSRRDKEGKRQNRTLRSEPCPGWRGRVDLPAACFNQYNVPCVAAILLFEPIGLRPHPNKGLCSKMNEEQQALERELEIRNRELQEAHSHIAALEEKLLKLKQYRRELKLLKEERRTLRKSAERRIGQVLLAPYRVFEKPAKRVWKKLHQQKPTLGNSVAQSEYQQWFQPQRASAATPAYSRDDAGVAADAR